MSVGLEKSEKLKELFERWIRRSRKLTVTPKSRESRMFVCCALRWAWKAHREGSP